MLHRILSVILLTSVVLSLSSCGGTSENSTKSNTLDSNISTTQESNNIPSEEEETTYTQWLNLLESKINELVAAEHIEYEELWNVYTTLSYIRDMELAFKVELFSRTKEDKDETYSETDILVDKANKVLDEMRQYFSEEEVEQWTLQRVNHTMAAWDTMEVDSFKVEDSRGNIDFDASWENYFWERIDPEVLAETYFTKSDIDLTIICSDGTKITNTGEHISDFGSIKMERKELAPEQYISSESLANNLDAITMEKYPIPSPWSTEYWNGEYNWQLFSAIQNITWTVPDNAVHGVLYQHLASIDNQYKVVGSFGFALDRYTWELTFIASDIEQSYKKMLETFSTLSLNGVLPEEEILEIQGLSSTIANLNMTETEKYQEKLYSKAAELQSTRIPYEDNLTGVFIDESDGMQVEIRGYRPSYDDLDEPLSSDMVENSQNDIYFLTIQIGNAKLESIPSAGAAFEYGSERNRVIFYLNHAFPNMKDSQFIMDYYQNGEYRFECILENADLGINQHIYDGELQHIQDSI